MDDPALRIIDVSWHLPDAGRDPAADFAARHISGAIFLDLADLADKNSLLPMMLPDATRFADHVGALGVGDDQRIVLYDDSALHTSARAWWMFVKVFGLGNVAILDGGLGKWISEGRPVTSDATALERAGLNVNHDTNAAFSKAQMLAGLGNPGLQIVDARPPSRFVGSEPEPRPNVVPGRIPGSLNLPYSQLFESDGCWKQGAALQAVFDEAGVDLTRPMVTTCGSGITAAVLSFGAHLLGKHDVTLYDGSWTEWGSDPALPKAAGPA